MRFSNQILKTDFQICISVPLKVSITNRQITATFAISMSGEFLPIQVIYEGKTKRCLPKYTFPFSSEATFSENHCSNTEKFLSFFNKIVFPHFKNVRKAKGYPDEQTSLIIMETFKGQDNNEVAKLCRKNNRALIIVPHNLTNKSQPLDITLKPAKSFIKDKYNMWYSEKVVKELNEDKAPADVEVSLNLSEIKPLHAK